MLQSIDQNLWASKTMLRRLGGMQIPVRMTIARLPDGGLWVHSPIRGDNRLFETLATLGPVQHVVAPNAHHHLYMHVWQRRFPEARFYASPALPMKRKDLRWDEVLGTVSPGAWGGVIDQIPIDGAPGIGEVVFLHKATKTLIVSDLVFHIRTTTTFMSWLTYSMVGAHGLVAQSRVWRLMVRDRAAAAASVERMLAWDFRRLVPTHGEIVEGIAKPHVQHALVWMRGGRKVVKALSAPA